MFYFAFNCITSYNFNIIKRYINTQCTYSHVKCTSIHKSIVLLQQNNLMKCAVCLTQHLSAKIDQIYFKKPLFSSSRSTLFSMLPLSQIESNGQCCTAKIDRYIICMQKRHPFCSWCICMWSVDRCALPRRERL